MLFDCDLRGLKVAVANPMIATQFIPHQGRQDIPPAVLCVAQAPAPRLHTLTVDYVLIQPTPF